MPTVGCLVYSDLCKLFLCGCVFGTIKTALRWNTVVWDGNYNGLRSMWLREEGEREDSSPPNTHTRALPPQPPCLAAVVQVKVQKGQKVKMGGGFFFFSFPEAGSHQSIPQVVGAMVPSVLSWPVGDTLFMASRDVTAAPDQPGAEGRSTMSF